MVTVLTWGPISVWGKTQSGGMPIAAASPIDKCAAIVLSRLLEASCSYNEAPGLDND